METLNTACAAFSSWLCSRRCPIYVSPALGCIFKLRGSCGTGWMVEVALNGRHSMEEITSASPLINITDPCLYNTVESQPPLPFK